MLVIAYITILAIAIPVMGRVTPARPRERAYPKSNKITAANTSLNGISFHRKGARRGHAAPATPGRVGHSDHDNTSSRLVSDGSFAAEMR